MSICWSECSLFALASTPENLILLELSANQSSFAQSQIITPNLSAYGGVINVASTIKLAFNC